MMLSIMKCLILLLPILMSFETAHLLVNGEGLKDCADWKPMYEFQHPQRIRSGWNLSIHLELQHNFTSNCSYSYEIHLRRMNANVKTCDTEIVQSYEEINHVKLLKAASSKIRFFNLTDGSYCCYFVYNQEYCHGSTFLRCFKHTEVTHLSDILEESLIADPEKSENSMEKYAIVAAVFVAVTLIIIFIILSCRRKYNRPTLTWQFKKVNTTDSELQNGVAQSFAKKEVTILYTQETPEVIETVIALAQFLRKSTDLIIRLDTDDEAQVRINPVGWYAKGDIFILVETAGSVLREEACINNKEVFHIDEDSLDPYFLYNFMRIVNNPNSIIDYSKYIVIHFTYTPTDVSFKTVALNKRYVISHHLPQLCHFLNYGKDLIPTTANLSKFAKRWEGSPELKSLNCAIERATKFVSRNPNYVDDIFRERSISSKETIIL